METMHRIAVAVVLLAATSIAVAADFYAGVRAYNRGDYAAALREWRPLAKQGDAAAQIRLGDMYANGKGVPKDDRQAVFWYRKAAEQGNARAQIRKEMVLEAQRALAALGYEPGPLDGRAGPRTTAAVRRFQRDYDMTPNGQISDELLAELRTADQNTTQAEEVKYKTKTFRFGATFGSSIGSK